MKIFQTPFRAIKNNSKYNINDITKSKIKHEFYLDIECIYSENFKSGGFNIYPHEWACVGRCNNGIYFCFEGYCFDDFTEKYGGMDLYTSRNFYEVLNYCETNILPYMM